jgi:hypothetical protein
MLLVEVHARSAGPRGRRLSCSRLALTLTHAVFELPVEMTTAVSTVVLT